MLYKACFSYVEKISDDRGFYRAYQSPVKELANQHLQWLERAALQAPELILLNDVSIYLGSINRENRSHGLFFPGKTGRTNY